MLNNTFKRKLYSSLMLTASYTAAIFTAFIVVFIIAYILIRAIPNVSWQLLSTKPSYINETIGVLPDILNTIYIVIATLVFVLPLGVGAAIYLSEYAKAPRIKKIIEYAIESLAGIPSIIYGLVGMLIFCQYFGLKTSLLAGALTLTIMNLPVIIRTTQESLDSVPLAYREGAAGLGANKWYSIRTVVLPCCIDGIITGCILAVGRMLGESAALLFTAGVAHKVNGMIDAMSSSGSTLTVALYVYAKEQGEFEVAFVIAAIMLIMSMLINFTARRLSKRIKNKRYN